MVGFSDAQEKAILDSAFTNTVYLRLLTGTAGQCVNDNGTLPAGCSELSTFGYTAMSIPSSYWASAIGGAPSIKTVPNPVHSPLRFTPTGGGWDICAFALTSDSNTITASNYLYGGVLVDVHNAPLVYHASDGVPFDITNQYPIVVRLGDPPIGVNPT